MLEIRSMLVPHIHSTMQQRKDVLLGRGRGGPSYWWYSLMAASPSQRRDCSPSGGLLEVRRRAARGKIVLFACGALSRGRDVGELRAAAKTSSLSPSPSHGRAPQQASKAAPLPMPSAHGLQRPIDVCCLSHMHPVVPASPASTLPLWAYLTLLIKLWNRAMPSSSSLGQVSASVHSTRPLGHPIAATDPTPHACLT